MSVFILPAALATCGCRESGVEKYDISGTVTYKGQPVPAGFVLFKPDTANGNSGPGSNAGLLNGHYATRPGQGVVGGKYIVQIASHDGIPFDMGNGVMNPVGKPLRSMYRAQIDLPKESTTFDIEIPVEKGK
jgi:hypothetical protein